jgi:hypothetical protein
MTSNCRKRNAGLAPGGFGEAANDTQNDTAREQGAQEWRSRTPPHLQVIVDLHRRYRPESPLPEAIQRSIGRAWRRA